MEINFSIREEDPSLGRVHNLTEGSLGRVQELLLVGLKVEIVLLGLDLGVCKTSLNRDEVDFELTHIIQKADHNS